MSTSLKILSIAGLAVVAYPPGLNSGGNAQMFSGTFGEP